MNAENLQAVALNGLGKMGVDWAATLLEAGYRVVGYDVSDAGRASAADRVAKGLKWIAKKRRADDPEFFARASARFSVVNSEAELIAEGQALVRRAFATGRVGGYSVQAAIAACSCSSRQRFSAPAGGMLPIGSRSQRLLNQSTHSRVANSTAS